MKRLRGFKGRYFRLTAIAALSGTLRQQKREVELCRHHRGTAREGESEGESPESPPPELRESATLYNLVSTRFAQKACHCNCLFKRKFRRLWYLYKFFFTPPGRYFKTKTGTSPPLSLSALSA